MPSNRLTLKRVRFVLVRLFWSLLIVVGGLGLWVQQGRLLEDMVEDRLERSFGTRAHVGEIELSIGSGIQLLDVALYSRRGTEWPAAFRCDRIDVDFQGYGFRLGQVHFHRSQVEVFNERGLDVELLRLLVEGEMIEFIPPMKFDRIDARVSGEGEIVAAMRASLDPRDVYELSCENLEIYSGVERELHFQTRIQVLGAAALNAQGNLKIPFEPEQFSLAIATPEGEPVQLHALGVQSILSAEVRELLRFNGITQGSLGLDVRVLGGHEDLISGLRGEFDLDDFNVSPGVLPLPFSHLKGRVSLVDGTLTVPLLEGIHERGAPCSHDSFPVTLSARVERVFDAAREGEVHFSCREAVIDQCFRDAADRNFVTSIISRGLHPSGTLSFEGGLRFDQTGLHRLQTKVQMQGVAVEVRGFSVTEGEEPVGSFPLPLEQIRGIVDVWEQGARFDKVFGWTETGGRVDAVGEYRYDSEREENVIELDVHGWNILIDDKLLDALGAAVRDPEVVQYWFQLLGLGGTVDVHVQVHVRGTEDVTWSVEVTPREARLQVEAFPYPIRIDAGLIRIEEERITMTGLRGGVDRSREGQVLGGNGTPLRLTDNTTSVELDGFFSTRPGGNEPFELLIEAFGVPLDDTLKYAFDTLVETGPGDDLWAELSPAGLVDLQVRWDRTAEGQADSVEVGVQPRGVHLKPAAYPLEVVDLRGEVTYRRQGDEPARMIAEPGRGLRARALGGSVTLSGEYLLDGGGELFLSAERIALDAQLFGALACVAPDFTAAVQTFHPSGWVQAQATLRRGKGRWFVAAVEVAPDRAPTPLEGIGVTLAIEGLPAPVEWQSGKISGRPIEEHVTFDNLQGRIGLADFALQEGSLQIVQTVGKLLTARGVLRSVPCAYWFFPSMASTPAGELRWRESGIVGSTHVELPSIRVFFEDDSARPRRVVIDAKVDVNRAGSEAFAIEGGMGHLDARISYERQLPGDHWIDRLVGQGQISDASFLKSGDLPLLFTGILADLEIKEGSLVVPGFEAEFSGGRFPRELNRARWSFQGERPYQIDLALRSADLERLHPTTKEWGGRIDALCSLSGSTAQPLKGRGRLEVRDGHLWGIPLFDSLYRLGISRILGQEDSPRFEQGSVNLELRQGYVAVNDLVLDGPALTMRGEGILGRSEFDLHVFPEVKVGIPLFGHLFRWLVTTVTRPVSSFRFQGPYDVPRVSWDLVQLKPDAANLDQPSASPRRPLPPRF